MRRRNLVVVRAGDESLHPQWLRSPQPRGWDLVVSYYGTRPDRYRDADAVRIDDPGSKWQGLHALLTRDARWRDYDYVWLPDDDLAVEPGTIEGLFRAMAEFGLALAQPALSWTSHYSHPVTVRHPSFRVRLTSFVEIMAPCFAADALLHCLPSFADTVSGWGLDFVWPTLLDRTAPRCGVIDEVEATHTRPVGGPSYGLVRAAGTTPAAELDAVLRKYAVPAGLEPHVYAAIDRGSRRLDGANPDDAARLRRLLDRDWAAFQARPHPHTAALTGDAG